MSSNPVNLALRFILEMVMIVVAAIWGWNRAKEFLNLFWQLEFPIILAVFWGIFAVKDDPSRSGKTIVQTPGIVRLIMELLFFGFACWALFDLGHQKLSLIMTIFVAGTLYLFN